MHGHHGAGDEAEEEVAERQVQDVECCRVVDPLVGNLMGYKDFQMSIRQPMLK